MRQRSRKQPKTASSKAAAAKKPGPALGAIEAALHPENTYDVEKFSRALCPTTPSSNHELLALANTD